MTIASSDNQLVGVGVGQTVETIGPEQHLGHFMIVVELRVVAEVEELPQRRLAGLVLTGQLA